MSVWDQFFGDHIMSVHLKENCLLKKKERKPWAWNIKTYDEKIEKSYLIDLMNQTHKEIEERDDWFLEIDRNYSKVIQLWNYRIVIVLPPVSNGIEITIVRPLTRLTFSDYNLDQNIEDLIKTNAKWILIAWSPWEWKTTFAQALIDYYVWLWKIVKTIESPRDLQVPIDVTQYSFSYAPHSEIRDILLLSRPDFTIYDEVRNQDDFSLFKDLRLTWIWLVWVIHATKPINVIQRFIWNIELWIIPEVVDTIIFIEWWSIKYIYQLVQEIKVPAWMKSEDLARPVIQVIDFLTTDIMYEIYSYGEEVITVPMNKIAENKNASPIFKYAKKYMEEFFANKYSFELLVEVVNQNQVDIYIPENRKWEVIGRWWDNITKTEKQLWVSLGVRTLKSLESKKIIPTINNQKWQKNEIMLEFGKENKNKQFYFIDSQKITYINTDVNWLTIIKSKKFTKSIENWNWFFIESM